MTQQKWGGLKHRDERRGERRGMRKMPQVDTHGKEKQERWKESRAGWKKSAEKEEGEEMQKSRGSLSPRDTLLLSPSLLTSL